MFGVFCLVEASIFAPDSVSIDAIDFFCNTLHSCFLLLMCNAPVVPFTEKQLHIVMLPPPCFSELLPTGSVFVSSDQGIFHLSSDLSKCLQMCISVLLFLAKVETVVPAAFRSSLIVFSLFPSLSLVWESAVISRVTITRGSVNFPLAYYQTSCTDKNSSVFSVRTFGSSMTFTMLPTYYVKASQPLVVSFIMTPEHLFRNISRTSGIISRFYVELVYFILALV